MVQDPLSVFYEALCVGMEWDENLQNDSSPVYSGQWCLYLMWIDTWQCQ